jgi:membrane carboxypeptidase/penicillin-binding protein
MSHLLTQIPTQWPPKPENVIGKNVCTTSGLLPPADGSCSTRFEYFIKGMEPKKYDAGRQKVFIDKTTNDLAKQGQTDNVEERDEVVVTDPTGTRYCVTCPHPEPSPSPTP